MKHLRPDYQNRIVDLAGKIKADEPVFLLRAQDLCSLPALSAYMTACVAEGVQVDFISSIIRASVAFSKFQGSYPERTKKPDLSNAGYVAPDNPHLHQKLVEYDKLKKDYEEYYSMYHEAVKEVELLSLKFSKAEEESNQYKSDVEELQKKVDALEKNNISLSSKNTQLDYDYKKLFSGNEILKNDNLQNVDLLKSKQDHIDALLKEIKTLEALKK